MNRPAPNAGVNLGKGRLKAILVIGALSTLGPFSVDTYFPSFPALAEHFGISETRMQSTLTWYLVALGVMNLFHGSMSDSFGRKRLILVSFMILSWLGYYGYKSRATAAAWASPVARP